MCDTENFRRLLEENLPFLQSKLLNLENFVPRADFEKLQQQLQNFDELKNNYKKLKADFDTLNNENQNLKSERENFSASVENLETEKKSLKRENQILQNKLSTANSKIETLQENLSESNEKLEKMTPELEYYKKSFAVSDSAYKKYLALSENIRYNLEGIFGDGSTIQGFLFGAANEKHLNEFWEYLRYSINDGRLSDDEKNNLSAIFDFCFDALNQSSRDKIFVRLQTEIGSRFDNRTMTRTSDSRQLGTVQKVFLEGYTNRIGNVVKPSLVLIGD